jgi:hypothetical protein
MALAQFIRGFQLSNEGMEPAVSDQRVTTKVWARGTSLTGAAVPLAVVAVAAAATGALVLVAAATGALVSVAPATGALVLVAAALTGAVVAVGVAVLELHAAPTSMMTIKRIVTKVYLYLRSMI